MTQQFHCWDYTLRILKNQLKNLCTPMFTAALFTIAKCWKQPKCPSVNQKELLPFVTTWMELENIMLSEISQAVKDKYHVISPRRGT